MKFQVSFFALLAAVAAAVLHCSTVSAITVSPIGPSSTLSAPPRSITSSGRDKRDFAAYAVAYPYVAGQHAAAVPAYATAPSYAASYVSSYTAYPYPAKTHLPSQHAYFP